MDDDKHNIIDTPAEKKRGLMDLFKYNAILSALFFIGSTLYLSGQVDNYSFDRFTISQLSYFLNPNQLAFFNLTFIIKSLLDLSFTYYVFKIFKSRLNIFTASVWLLAVLSFGLIVLFPGRFRSLFSL